LRDREGEDNRKDARIMSDKKNQRDRRLSAEYDACMSCLLAETLI
jgi:hypothetical protein